MGAYLPLSLFTVGSIKEVSGNGTKRVALAAEPQGRIIITDQNRYDLVQREYKEKDLVICYPRVDGVSLDRDFHIYIGEIPQGVRRSTLIELDAHLECRTHTIRIPLLSIFHVS